MKNQIQYRLSQLIQFPIVFAIVVVAATFVPSIHWSEISSHDNHRIVQVLVAIVGGIVVVRRLIRHSSIPSLFGNASLILLGFFCLGLWSGLLAWSVPHAMFEWANFGLLVGLAWLVAATMDGAKTGLLDRVLLIVGIGCALYVFSWSIVYVSWQIVGDQPDWSTLIAGFDNYRFFNHVQTVTLPLLALLVVRRRQSTGRLAMRHPSTLVSLLQRHCAGFWWGILILWWTLFLVTAGRGTFLGLFAGLVMALVWRGRLALEWCRLVASTFVVGLIVYLVLYTLVPMAAGAKPFGLLQEVATRTVTNPTSDRLALWNRAIQMIIERPLLGTGPLHFAHYGRDITNGAHPHNWALQISSEWGVPAFLCLATVLVIALRALLRTGRAIKADDAPNQAILATWLATLVAIIVDGLVSGLLVMPSSQLWIALYAGCAWGWTRSFSSPDTLAAHHRMHAGQRYAAAVGIVLLMFFAGRGLWPEIKDLPAHEEKIQNEGLKYGSDRMFPRIWRAGYF